MNSFGNIFRITTWGESHGPAMGVVIDGCPSGLKLDEDEITEYLRVNDRPIPEIATGRIEPNKAELMSGINNGKTLGTPISVIIRNCDIVKKDYGNLKGIFRPGHGDYTYYKKYNIDNISGGGRSSGRECITRLVAGYIAEKIIKSHYKDFSIKSKILGMAGINISDDISFSKSIKKVEEISGRKDSSGGLVKITIEGLPAGLGEPVFDGLDAKLAGAVMSIGSVKSVDIGLGRECAGYCGSQFNDDFELKEEKLGFSSNNNGGIQGGISNGCRIELTISVKPTPSIGIEKTGASSDNTLQKITVNGRHDKNITPRIAPIAGAMSALVIIDHLMLCGRISKDKM